LVARTLFVDPLAPVDGARYQLLLDNGFRRSGAHIYRPECGECRRCIPVRIPAAELRLNRSQRRNLARNRSDLEIVQRSAGFYPEHYELYVAYLRGRHPGSGMAEEVSADTYRDFLIAPWGGETLLLEMRLRGRLAAVAVTDVLPRSLSAVYTFFAPEHARRALGTYAILTQAALAGNLGLAHLYLGYWIEECRKMSYKDSFRPIEAFIAGRWRRFEREDVIDWRG
jgi:arginine-tRNA-protein transferase